MKKSLIKYIAMAGIALATFLPNKTLKAQSQELNSPTPIEVAVNPFDRPNQQERVGFPLNQSYRSDGQGIVDYDGDGIAGTSFDQSIQDNLSSGQTSYIPGYNWGKSLDQEQISWLEKMIQLSGVHNIPRVYDWDCKNFTEQNLINSFGISNFEQYLQNKTPEGKIQFSENNSKFNLPIYEVFLKTLDGRDHAINGILVGDNPLNFNDWRFFEPQTENRILPGDWNMALDGPVNIFWYGYHSLTGQPMFSPIKLINFNLEGGQVSDTTFINPIMPRTNPHKTLLSTNQLENKVLDYYEGINLQNHLSELGNPEVSTNVELGENFYHEDETYKLVGENVIETENEFSEPFYPNPENMKNYIVQRRIIENLVQRTYRTYKPNPAYEKDKPYDFTIKSDTTYQQVEVDEGTAVQEDPSISQGYYLYQNYPNPFNPSTKIKYKTDKFGDIKFGLYSASTGELIESRVKSAVGPGEHEFEWGGLDKYASGTYILLMQQNGKVHKRIKMSLIK